MRIAFLGTRRLGYEGLELLIEMRHEIVAAFTFEYEITEGRHTSAFRELCGRRGIQLFEVEQINRPPFINLFREWAPDLIVSLYWKRLVGAEILAASRFGGVGG